MSREELPEFRVEHDGMLQVYPQGTAIVSLAYVGPISGLIDQLNTMLNGRDAHIDLRRAVINFAPRSPND